jgi:hypothetical protein
MSASRDLLGESKCRAANDDFCLVRHIAGRHRAEDSAPRVARQVADVGRRTSASSSSAAGSAAPGDYSGSGLSLVSGAQMSATMPSR